MSNAAKWVVGIVVVALVIWGLVAANKNKNQSDSGNLTKSEETGPYKIGVIGPFTGDAAIYGEALKETVEMTIDEVNSQGGVNGRMLEAVFEDGRCNGKDGANAAQKLVNADKVQVIIGGFCSSETLAAIPIVNQAKVALLSPSSSSPDLTGISPFFARNYPSDSAQGKVLAEVANKKGWKTVAFIVENKDYPLGIYKAFDSKYVELGGKTIKEEFPPEAMDFRSQITKLKSQNPDALFLDTQTPATIERILKQLQESNWKIPLLASDILPGDPPTVERNKNMLEGTLVAEFGTNSENPKFKKMVESFKTKYQKEMNYQNYMQCGYDLVYLIKEGIQTQGYNGEKIASWFRTINNWEGASGKITMQPDGDRASGHSPEIIKNGKVEPFVE